MTAETYATFLSRKAPRDELRALPDASVPDTSLFDWQAEIVEWALRRGRAALFTATGTGKTRMQLAWAHGVLRATNRDVLILAPLAVSAQTAREAETIGLSVTVCREVSDVRVGVNITNYERLERFDPANFGAIVLDESSILRDHTGATRQMIQRWADRIPYRLACTATPVPNDVQEIVTHSAFVGAMTTAEALATFFVKDEAGTRTDSYRLKGYARDQFFAWMASWSVALRNPTDLGYDGSEFILPTLHEHEILVPSRRDPGDALFVGNASTMTERREARTSTLAERVWKVAELVDRERDEPWLIWCDYNAEAEALCEAIPGAVEVRGPMDADEKERLLLAFTDGEIRYLVTKPRIAGHGMNWQHCARIAFVGISDSWEARYQAVRRCHRFGQSREVHVWTVRAEDEQRVADNVARKARQAGEMADGMVSAMAKEWQGVRDVHAKHERDVVHGEDWTMHLGDSAEVLSELAEESVGLSVFSPPFPGLYVYSATQRDVGNASNVTSLVDHLRYIAGDPLLRVTMPGRLCCLHLMQVPAFAWRDGAAGLHDFRGPTIAMMVAEGWIYAGEVLVDKNPQAQAIRTKEHSLLFKTLATDASRLRMALGDYVLIFRKLGDNLKPIKAGAGSKYNPGGGWVSQEEWIEWAAPVWYRKTQGLPGGISETDVLNVAIARAEGDERHLAPLQLGVIERCVRLWSNPGEVVLSPFAGIGSEGVGALRHGRKFIGIELKRSYFETARRNLEAVVQQRGQGVLDLAEA